MTGTGTQTDPYLVDNWADFVTAVKQSKKYVELTADIDMNDAAPEGITTTVSVYSTEINGNGHIIKNLYYHGTNIYGAFHFTGNNTVSELNILDCLVKSGRLFTLGNGGTGNILLYQCQFSGIVNNAILAYIQAGATMQRCGLNFDLSACSVFPQYNLTRQVEFINSHIKFSGTDLTNLLLNADNSLIQGSMAGSGTVNFYGANRDSVINAGISGFTGITASSASNILINSDLCSVSCPSGFTAVTGEQLRNAEYLRSIGFPIGV